MGKKTHNVRARRAEREPPHDKEYEQALLGALLIEPGRLNDVGELDGEAFYLGAHQTVFGVVCKLAADREPVDWRTVTGALKRDGLLEEVGGEIYLTQLSEDAADPVNVGYYAQKLVGLHRLRQLIQIGDRLSEQAYSVALDPGDLAQGFLNEIQALNAIRGKSRLIVQEATDMKMKPTTWIWQDRIVADSLNGLCALPDAGKTTVACGIAAIISAGAAWPDRPGVTREPQSVLFLSTEDHCEVVLGPRLIAAGADLSRIAFIKTVQRPGEPPSMLNLSRDLHEIDRELQSRPDVGLVVIDPLMGVLGSKVDTHRDAQVRDVLGPFCEMLERRCVTALAITHLNKASSVTQAVLRLMGSMAFVAQCRSVWFIDRDPADDRSRLLVPIKNNLSPVRTGLRFSIVSAETEFGPQARAAWHDGVVITTADELLEARNASKTRRPRDDAEDWLRRRLSGGPVLSSVILAEAEDMHFSERTLARAKKALDVATRYLSVPGHKTKVPHMILPSHAGTETTDEILPTIVPIHTSGITYITGKTSMEEMPQMPVVPFMPEG